MGRRTPGLPRDIVESILLKLPVKPLLRFKSVSKSWNTIVSDPVFVRNHDHQSVLKPQNLFLRRRSDAPDLCLVKLSEDGKLQTINELIETPLIDPPWRGDRLCFSEYGVLLITNNRHYSERCLLWNPSTRGTRRISLPYCLDTCCSGICYDSSIDDFKVVVLYTDFYAVYSCKKQSWSNKKQLPQDHISADIRAQPNSSGVSISGAIYWLLGKMENINAEIIYYDARDDGIKILPKPEDVLGYSLSYLVDLGGHLCLYGYGNRLDRVRIWKKEKGIDNNSWTELISMPNAGIVGTPFFMLEPVCYVGNKILFQYNFKDDDKKIWVYSPLDNTFEQVEGRVIGVQSLIPYRETLYLHSYLSQDDQGQVNRFI